MIRDDKSNNEETIAKLLGAIIFRETSKPDGECDTELVKACEEELASLDMSANVSEEELNEKLIAIMGKKQGDECELNKKRKRLIKRISVIAACFILAVGLLTLTAYATVPSFNNIIQRMLHMPDGSSINDGAITYIKAGEKKQYLSLDELIEAEKLSDYGIIFPKDLPDELKISSVEYIAYDDVKEVDIEFFNGSDSMGIYIGKNVGAEPSTMKLLINEFVVYISERDGVYASVMTYDNNLYCITSANKDTIITIFEHMNRG